MKPAKLHVAAAQMKFRPTIRENVERIIELINSSARDGVDAILFPECAVTGYRREFKGLEPGSVDRACAEVARAAPGMRWNVLVGAPALRNWWRLNALLDFGAR